MAIRIQTEETFIPIEFGELSFKFPLDDESIKKIRNTKEEFEEKAKELDKKVASNELSDDEEFEETKKIVGHAYDYILGDGAFDKVYKQTPSIQILTKYFVELAESLIEEIEQKGFSEDQQEKMQKYLKDNKKK